MHAGRNIAVFEAGTGVLPMMCAASEARSVVGAPCLRNIAQRTADMRALGAAYERSDLLARMAQQTIDANAGMHGAAGVAVKVTARALLESADGPAAEVVVCGA